MRLRNIGVGRMGGSEPPTLNDKSGQQRGKNSKPRTRTYTGCWTCRARHIKCDMEKPACFKCINSGYTCEGYGVRLSWNAVMGPGRFQRAKSPGVATTMPTESTFQPFRENDAVIDQPAMNDFRDGEGDDNNSIGERSRTTTSSSSLRLNDTDCQSQQPQSAVDVPDLSCSSSAFPATGTTPESHPLWTYTLGASPEQGHLRDAQWLRSSELGPNLASELTTNTDRYPARDGATDRGGGDNSCILSRANEVRPVLDGGQRASRADVPTINRLLEYWIVHLSDMLTPMPIPTAPSYLNNILLSMAFQGARQRPQSKSPASAVFHLIISLSASHMGATAQGTEETQMASLAIEHHSLALVSLQSNVLLDDPQNYAGILAAFLLCIIKESVTVGATSWQLHVQGACHWVRTVNQDVWTESRSTSVLYQTFLAILTFAKSQLVPDVEADRVIANTLLDFDHPGNLYQLDTLIGIPEKILHAIKTMNQLRFGTTNSHSSLIASNRATALSTTETSSLDMDAFEMDLLLSLPLNDDPVPIPVDDGRMLIYHHSCIYYYASLVYFKRSVRGVSLGDVQGLVSKFWDHVKLLTRFISRPFSPGVWPIAVVLFEIAEPTGQAHATDWLHTMFKLTSFEVWASLKSLAAAYWVARGESPHLPWQDFLRERDGGRLILF